MNSSEAGRRGSLLSPWARTYPHPTTHPLHTHTYMYTHWGWGQVTFCLSEKLATSLLALPQQKAKITHTVEPPEMLEDKWHLLPSRWALQNELHRHWRGRLQAFSSCRRVAAKAERSSTPQPSCFIFVSLCPFGLQNQYASHHSPLMGWSMLTNRQLMLSCLGTHSSVPVCCCT